MAAKNQVGGYNFTVRGKPVRVGVEGTPAQQEKGRNIAKCMPKLESMLEAAGCPIKPEVDWGGMQGDRLPVHLGPDELMIGLRTPGTMRMVWQAKIKESPGLQGFDVEAPQKTADDA